MSKRGRAGLRGFTLRNQVPVIKGPNKTREMITRARIMLLLISSNIICYITWKRWCSRRVSLTPFQQINDRWGLTSLSAWRTQISFLPFNKGDICCFTSDILVVTSADPLPFGFPAVDHYTMPGYLTQLRIQMQTWRKSRNQSPLCRIWALYSI